MSQIELFEESFGLLKRVEIDFALAYLR